MQTPCVLWHKSITTGGYGQVSYEGKPKRAHRVAYCKAHGLHLSDIKGLVVRHKCDNPPCVNPEHLELGTLKDNTRDMVVRGRRYQPEVAGIANGRAVLTPEQVVYLRSVYCKGCKDFGVAGLARRVGVSESTVRFVVKGRTWPST